MAELFVICCALIYTQEVGIDRSDKRKKYTWFKHVIDPHIHLLNKNCIEIQRNFSNAIDLIVVVFFCIWKLKTFETDQLNA